MKHTHIQHLRIVALVGAMATALCGCQKDDLVPQTSIDPQGELQITVVDGGYTGNAATYNNGTWSEQPQTRATENGYKTTFTANDKVGIYAVKSGTLTATNVCLTLTSDVWTLPNGTKLPADADRYFVYYPYQSSVSGAVAPAATNADDFFANVITNWALTTDQSGTNYTKQDLMVGSGTLGTPPVNGKYPLTVVLSHKMGLAVIKLPTGATDITFTSFTPYTGVSGEYRYLVKPNTDAPLLGSFVEGGEVRGYTINANIEAGAYKTYTVQGKPKYAIGDPYPDATNPIGVVFWLDEKDPTYDSANKKGLKGKIVSLDEPVANWNGGTNEAGKLKWSTEQVTTGATSTSDGAANTLKITQTANYSSTVYPAVAWCVAKNTGGVTGWYLPAKDELLTLYYVITTVNSSLQTVGATKLSLSQYWSSMEDDSVYSVAVHFSGGTTYITKKNSAYSLRCVREMMP